MRHGASAIWGTELFLVGGLVSVVTGHALTAAFLGVGAVGGAVISAAVAGSAGRSSGASLAAVLLSFASMVPGGMFFVDLLQRQGGHCYERPWFGCSAAWLLVGPALIVASFVVSPWRLQSLSLFAIRTLHILGWLIGASYTFLCAMAM